MGTTSVGFLFLSALLHLGSSGSPETTTSIAIWNLEQFSWLLALFTLALAIGEASPDLFDKVFVRLQIAFVLLATLMILAIIQTEKAEYQAGIRNRTGQLAEFVRAHVDYFRQRNEPLSTVLEREDFLQRLTLGFGKLPELKAVRIRAGRELASFEIGRNGVIRRGLETVAATLALPQPDSDLYFPIQALPLRAARQGQVEFYGTREFLDRHLRKRILVIFSLFTGMVALATAMIGLVVRGASATIRQQASEIEDTQRRLMQASKLAAIGELAAGVAHEINNPVTAILSRASFLSSQRNSADAAGDREDLNAIATQAQRIAQITRGLLMFSRPQALNLAAVPMERVIETSLGALGGPLAAGNISVERHLPPDLPRVMADEDTLARALENLFRNAIDAMPNGGTLKISAAADGRPSGRLRLAIEDSGTGIAEAHLPRIFDPFFTTKEVGKGTGLGLSIVHGVIKEHCGAITVAS